MMKLVGLLVLFVVAFALTLGGLLAATGNLSKESLDAVMGAKPSEAKTAGPEAQDLGSLAAQLKAERQQIQERQEELDRKEKHLEIVQKDLDERRTELENLLGQVKQEMTTADAAKQQRLQDVVKTMEGMEAERAAQVLTGWPVDEAAQILGQLSERARGPILDAMETDKVMLILRALRESKASTDEGKTPTGEAKAPTSK